jgi:hypothetical protein
MQTRRRKLDKKLVLLDRKGKKKARTRKYISNLRRHSITEAIK